MVKATRPVLIVDDDADSRAFLGMVLQMIGCRVVVAADGEEALALARDHQPCLILLDLMMPGMDGFSFREEQLRTPELAGIPVILISALREEQVQGRLGKVPAVAKPIDLDELLSKVAAVCA
jgi:CheY-like chemotaxis protein